MASERGGQGLGRAKDGTLCFSRARTSFALGEQDVVPSARVNTLQDGAAAMFEWFAKTLR